MPHTTIYRPELDIIETKYQGVVTINEFKDMAAEISRIASEHNCHATLGDYREATVHMSVSEIYELPNALRELMAEHGATIQKFKRAFVTNKDVRDFLFFETVAANRGQNTRVFQDFEEAVKWLTEK